MFPRDNRFRLATMRLPGLAAILMIMTSLARELDPVRCLIVDDSAQFLEAATALLEREGLIVVGTASTSFDGLRLAAELRPDVTLVDIDLGAESGFDLAERLTERNAQRSAVILVSTHAERDFVDLIQASGADGFVPKSELSADAIHEILRRRSR